MVFEAGRYIYPYRDEMWIFYHRIIKNRCWEKRGEESEAKPKPNKRNKKVMLCLWWDWAGPIHYELLSSNQVVNPDI